MRISRDMARAVKTDGYMETRTFVYFTTKRGEDVFIWRKNKKTKELDICRASR